MTVSTLADALVRDVDDERTYIELWDISDISIAGFSGEVALKLTEQDALSCLANICHDDNVGGLQYVYGRELPYWVPIFLTANPGDAVWTPLCEDCYGWLADYFNRLDNLPPI